MRILINSIMAIVFVMQVLSTMLNAFNMQKSDDAWIIVRNCFIFVSFICSDIIVIVFVLLYNFDFEFLKKKTVNCILFLISVIAGCVHIYQIVGLKDFFVISCLLILIDMYVICRIVQNAISKY